MNFICSITHTLIEKSDPVRIFFIESHNDPVFPFMNYCQATSTGNFKPLGCAFKAKFEDNDHDEYFSFSLDDKESPLVEGLLEYINNNQLRKKEAKEHNLLGHNSEDISWGHIDTLQELFHRCRDQSVYFKNEYKGVFPFVSVMVMHEAAYKMILKHGDINGALERYNKEIKKDCYTQKKERVNAFIKSNLEEVEELRGKMHKANLEENVIITEEIFNQNIKELEELKNSYDPETLQIYEKAKQEFFEEIGTEKNMLIYKERFVDDDYIQWFMEDVYKDSFRLSNINEEALKAAAYNRNSENHVISDQIEKIASSKNWTKKNWLPLLEAYLVEFFLTYNGYEFLPSRRHYLYQHLENKEFFKELTELKVYKS